MKPWIAVALAVLCLAIGGGVGYYIGAEGQGDNDEKIEKQLQAIQQRLAEDPEGAVGLDWSKLEQEGGAGLDWSKVEP